MLWHFTIFIMSWDRGKIKGNVYSNRINAIHRHWFLCFLARWLAFSSVSHPEIQIFKSGMSVCSTGVCFAVVNQYFLLQNTRRVILPRVNSVPWKLRSASGLVSQDETEIYLGKMWANFHVYDSWRKISRKKLYKRKKKITKHGKTLSKTHMFGLWELELCAAGTRGTVGQSLWPTCY